MSQGWQPCRRRAVVSGLEGSTTMSMVQLVHDTARGDGLSPPVYMHRVMWRRQQRRRFGHTARAATHGGWAGGGEGLFGLQSRIIQ